MNIFTKHITQCDQSEQLADASGRLVDLMNRMRIDTYTDVSAMVVEGRGLRGEDILVPLVHSIIISWTFRILAHGESQYSYVYSILGHFCV